MKTADLQNDIDFLKHAVQRSGRTPPVVFFVWAIVVGGGAAVVAWRPDASPLYWAVAAPVGVMASAYLGWRHGRRTGIAGRTAGVRATLHWVGVVVAVFGAALLVPGGLIAPEAMAPLSLLIVALGYFVAGVHLDPTHYGPSLIAGGAFVALVFGVSWVATGVACAAGLALVGVIALRSSPVRAHE